MKNKKMIILTLITGIIVTTIGITYSIFTSSKTGKNSNLVVGDVYMHYANGNKSINLANVMPSETYDETSFFEFTIDGKNTTTNKDIWYEIILKHGDEVSGKTRIKDNLLKFTLTETKNGTTKTVFDGRSYNDLTNKRIWVNTINKNTTSEVSITYRLYMWISNNTVIGNVNQDYTMEEWKNIFASIKVDVAGDFNEKSIATDESCFNTNQIDNNGITELEIVSYDTSCGTDVIIPSKIDGYKVTSIANCEITAQSNNINTVVGNLNYYTNKNYKLKNASFQGCGFQYANLTSVTIPDGVTSIGIDAFSNNQLKSIVIPNSVTTIEDYAFEHNQLTSVIIPDSVTRIGNRAFSYNQLADIDIPDSVIEIGNLAFNNNKLADSQAYIYKRTDANNDGIAEIDKTTIISYGGAKKEIIIPNNIQIIDNFAFANAELTSVEIPSSVTTIGAAAFSSNKLMSAKIPDSVITIADAAFEYNKLTSIEVPDSVTTIGSGVFRYNQLINVIIGKGVKYISLDLFGKASVSNPNLSKITINRSCIDIKNIPASSFESAKYYPWLTSSSPYTVSGVTIYGSNNEVCDSY